MPFTNALPSFLKRNPGATALATIAVITGVYMSVTKTTPTVAIRNEKIVEFKTSSGAGVYITGSGALTMSGKLIIQRPTDIGWSFVDSANQACNTTCTNACVFGEDTGVIGTLVACTDATADHCLCAGSN